MTEDEVEALVRAVTRDGVLTESELLAAIERYDEYLAGRGMKSDPRLITALRKRDTSDK